MTINASSIIPCRTASCSVMGDYAIKKKMNVKWGSQKRGDIVLFDFNHNGTSDHTGIVVSVNKDGTITTIEGNTSTGNNCNGGAVMRRTRVKGNVNYFVRPKYNSNVTPDMLVATAEAEVGVKESPRNSNNVKYNTWYYGHAVKGSAYPWCMTFVEWLFAHVREDIKPVTKPTGKYSGVIPQPTLQRGSKGDSVKNLQKFLNWYHSAWKLAVDGDFGGATDNAVRVFQKTEGISSDGIFGKDSFAKANAYKGTTPPTPTGYTGAFPDLVTHSGQKIAYTARALAYAKGTKKATYTYPKGKAKQAFTTAINKVFPKRSSWSKQCQAGASCDVGAATIIRYSGIDSKVPRGLQEQIPHFKKSSLWKKTGLNKCQKAGDVALHSGKGSHIWIGLGDGNLAEANHTWKFFEHIATDNRSVKGKQNGAVYRATKASPIVKGDRGTEVKKLQSFLNWAGFNCGAADGEAGDKTVTAIKAFQTKVGLTADGAFGTGSLAKAKTYKR